MKRKRVKRHPLYAITVCKWCVGKTEITFYRKPYHYHVYTPTYASLNRLEQHMTQCRIMLGQTWVSITRYLP